ncbi:MAG: hypothetical protein AAGC46_15890 [Solirubrobacteraceae bacterium]|nr:hypothetical protein [Patulibacter sp.]
MSHAPLRHPRAIAATAAVLATSAAGLAAAVPAHAQTKAPTVNTVVLHMTGSMSMKFDKAFLKVVKQDKATLSVKSGGTYSSKLRTATLPIDTTSTVTVTPATADILAKGTVMIRKKSGKKAAASNIGLRLRDSGADLSGTVRGKAGREFAQLTVSSTIDVQQTDSGYAFVDVLMLVSPDMAKAAKQAGLKGITAGQTMGLMTATVNANLPSFTLPGLGNLVPGLGSLTGG